MDPLRFDEAGKVVLPRPEEISKKEREQGAGTYIMMFAGTYLPLPLIELIMSIAYFFYHRRKSRFVSFHSYQSLLTQIPISIFNTGLVVWTIINLYPYIMSQNPDDLTGFTEPFWIFLCFVVLWNIIYIIYSLIAYKQAGKGKLFYMLIFGRYAYARYYSRNAVHYSDSPAKPEENIPPPGFEE